MLNVLFTIAFCIVNKPKLSEMGVAGKIVASGIPEFADLPQSFTWRGLST